MKWYIVGFIVALLSTFQPAATAPALSNNSEQNEISKGKFHTNQNNHNDHDAQVMDRQNHSPVTRLMRNAIAPTVSTALGLGAGAAVAGFTVTYRKNHPSPLSQPSTDNSDPGGADADDHHIDNGDAAGDDDNGEIEDENDLDENEVENDCSAEELGSPCNTVLATPALMNTPGRRNTRSASSSNTKTFSSSSHEANNPFAFQIPVQNRHESHLHNNEDGSNGLERFNDNNAGRSTSPLQKTLTAPVTAIRLRTLHSKTGAKEPINRDIKDCTQKSLRSFDKSQIGVHGVEVAERTYQLRKIDSERGSQNLDSDRGSQNLDSERGFQNLDSERGSQNLDSERGFQNLDSDRGFQNDRSRSRLPNTIARMSSQRSGHGVSPNDNGGIRLQQRSESPDDNILRRDREVTPTSYHSPDLRSITQIGMSNEEESGFVAPDWDNMYSIPHVVSVIKMEDFAQLRSMFVQGRVDMSAVDDVGRALVHYAAKCRDPRILLEFAVRGADLEVLHPTTRRTLMHTAARSRFNAAARIQVLLYCLPSERTLATVRARDVIGKTALHLAAKYADPLALRVLLDAGADIDARDKGGDTALTTARDFGNYENVQFLLTRN